MNEKDDEPLVAAPNPKEHRSRLWLEMMFAQIPELRARVAYTATNINPYEYYVKSGIASYILALPTPCEGVCLLEPEFALPYSTFFVQSKSADPEIADLIYDILNFQLNED